MLSILPAIAMTQTCGCESIVLDDSAQVNSTSASLASPSGVSGIPDSGVEVCFQIVKTGDWVGGTFVPDPFGPVNLYIDLVDASPTTVAYIEMVKSTVNDYLESNGRVNVDFHGWYACPDTADGTFVGGLRYVVHVNGQAPAGFRHADSNGVLLNRFGYTATMENWIGVSVGYYGSNDNVAVLHEFGHALGFIHEFDRDDTQQPNVSATPSSCSIVLGGAVGTDGLTTYDVDSIMNSSYCHWNAQLSRLDWLGMEIMYPAEFSHRPAVRFGFLSGDGQVVAYPGAEFAQNWVRRGATEEAFSRMPAWWLNGERRSPSVASIVLDAEGEYVLAGDFEDRRGRLHEIEATEVNVSRRLFASIAANFI